MSADFNDHPVGYFLEGLLKNSDRTKIEFLAFSNSTKISPQTKKIKPFFKEWHSIISLTDKEAAAIIFKSSVDILIDLSGHTGGNRLSVFSYRPAPVQATWFGYFASTGIEEIDFVIGDKYVTPLCSKTDYTEQIIWLPNSYFCFHPPDNCPAISETPALKKNIITFGCFNKASKITPETIGMWSKILRRVPYSEMLFKGDDYVQGREESIKEAFNYLGIDKKRLLFKGRSTRDELLGAYANIDIALDTSPYPGVTTTCEALWMGVPTVTKDGDNFLTRGGVTIATNSGHRELYL